MNGITIANFPSDVLWSTGVLFNGATKFGATEGPPKFTPNISYENTPFDGKFADVAELDRVFYGNPVISLTLLEMGITATGNQIDTFLPGNTDATSGATPPVTTFTPQPAGGFVASAKYLTDLRCIWERGYEGSSKYVAIYFPLALCTKWDIAGRDKKNALIAAEFTGRIDKSGSLAVAPFKIEIRTDLPA